MFHKECKVDSTNSSPQKAIEPQTIKPEIEIANKYQSLHIGCNNYQQAKTNSFREVY